MLDVVRSEARRRAVAAALDVEILSLATANPGFRLPQAEAARYAKDLYPRLKKFWQVYDNTAIDFRYNCEPIDWYLRPHSWEERTKSFHKHALDLLEQVTVRAVEAAGVPLDAIDMIVTNTVTGLAVPSLEAKLFNRLKFASTVERCRFRNESAPGLGEPRATAKSLAGRIAPQLEERILAALKAGETIRGVADKFDVNPSTVQRIKHPFVVAA
jgi:hypothetical protein